MERKVSNNMTCRCVFGAPSGNKGACSNGRRGRSSVVVVVVVVVVVFISMYKNLT